VRVYVNALYNHPRWPLVWRGPQFDPSNLQIVPLSVVDKPLLVLHEVSPRNYTRLPSVQSSYPFPLCLAAPWKETWALISTGVAVDNDKQ
jgi:hypothetical protein